MNDSEITLKQVIGGIVAALVVVVIIAVVSSVSFVAPSLLALAKSVCVLIHWPTV